MSFRCDPVRFECYDEIGQLVFSVEACDEHCATVEIKTLVTVESWAEISAEISKCLSKMNLAAEHETAATPD
jgi:hypothetical protein